MKERLEGILAWVEERQDRIVDDIVALAEIDSLSGDRGGVTRCVQQVEMQFNGLLDDSRIIMTDSGPVLIGDFGMGAELFLLLAHSDTVWPVKAGNKPPLGKENGLLRGPGVLDMKGSIVMIRYAFAALRDLGLQPAVGLRFLLTPDEEIGSPNSAGLIRDQARKARAAFVPEPAQYTETLYGAVKRSRKGSAKYVIRVIGREAHAGTNPEDGINAVHLSGEVINTIASLNNPAKGQLCNATIINGGTAANAIPAVVEISVDARFSTMEAGQHIDNSIKSLTLAHPEAVLQVNGGISRPPMVLTEAISGMIDIYQKAASELGLQIAALDTGGGSDGNLTADEGLPTLDGIGLDGRGAHTADEHINLETLPNRFALFTETLLRCAEAMA